MIDTKGDDFGVGSQLSARAAGEYDRIAREVESSGRCVFCDLRDKYVITRENGWVLTVNLFPRSTGDLVLIPKRHIERYHELTEADVAAMGGLTQLGKRLLREGLGIDSTYVLLRDGSGTDKTVRHLHGQIMNDRPGLITWHPERGPKDPIEVAQKLKAVGGVESLDREDEQVVAKDNGWILTPDQNPFSRGDMRIKPVQKVSCYEDLTPSDFAAVARLNLLGMCLLDTGLKRDSFYLQTREGIGADSDAEGVEFKILCYWKGLITWNIQDSIVEPIKVAEKLRATLERIKNGNN